MFENLWFVICFLLPLLPSVAIVGTLTFAGWVLVANQKPFRVPATLVVLTVAVLCDSVSLINSFLAGKLFPMTAHGGSLVPFFYIWQFVSFALIVAAGACLRKERAVLNRPIIWGTICQLVMHCSEFLLFVVLRFT